MSLTIIIITQINITRKKRDALFHTAKTTGNPTDHVKYNQRRNQVVCMLRDGKQLFFNQQLTNVDAKTFWKTIWLLNQDYSSRVPTLLDGTTPIESSLDKATTLNNFYTCFNNRQPPPLDLPENLHPPNECPSELLCTKESVFELLSNLDTTKSIGSDSISSKC